MHTVVAALSFLFISTDPLTDPLFFCWCRVLPIPAVWRGGEGGGGLVQSSWRAAGWFPMEIMRTDKKGEKKEELSATHLPGVHFDQQKNSRHVICIAGQLSSAMAQRGGGEARLHARVFQAVDWPLGNVTSTGRFVANAINSKFSFICFEIRFWFIRERFDILFT